MRPDAPDIAAEVGRRIRELREATGMRREAVAVHLDVSANVVGQWERGELIPSLRRVRQLAVVLGVTAGEIIDGAAA